MAQKQKIYTRSNILIPHIRFHKVRSNKVLKCCYTPPVFFMAIFELNPMLAIHVVYSLWIVPYKEQNFWNLEKL
jgi:hypothetical protein